MILHRDKYSGMRSVKVPNPARRAGESSGRSTGRSSNEMIVVAQYAPLVNVSRDRASGARYLPHVLFPAFADTKASIGLL